MTCRECVHCYTEIAGGWEFPAPFESFNVCGACDLVNPDRGHVASHTRLNGGNCEHFQQRPHPVRIYPPRTEKMMKAGQWWTDIEPMQKVQELKPEPIPAQRSLEAFL